MRQEAGQAEVIIKKIQLKKFNNRPDGVKEKEPFEIWEGENEESMKLIYSKDKANAVN